MRIQRSIMRCSIVFWALLLAVSPIAASEGEDAEVSPLREEGPRPASGPEAALEIFVEAARESDWARCSQMMHPEALAEFHKAFVAIAQSDESGEVARFFFGLESGEEVAKLSPASTFEKVMQASIAMFPVNCAKVMATSAIESPISARESSKRTVMVVGSLLCFIALKKFECFSFLIKKG